MGKVRRRGRYMDGECEEEVVGVGDGKERSGRWKREEWAREREREREREEYKGWERDW